MIFLGIDPGASGALVALSGQQVVLCEPMPYAPKVGVLLPDLADMMEGLVDEHEDESFGYRVHVILERAQAFPGEGAMGAFRYGAGWGGIQGVLAALRVPYETVPSSTWHAALCGKHQRKGQGKAQAKAEAKARALQVVQQRLPVLELPKARVRREGVVDAACLALYGQLKHGAMGRAA